MLVIIHLISGTDIKITDMTPPDVSLLLDGYKEEDYPGVLTISMGEGNDNSGEVGPGVLHIRRDHIVYIEVR